MLTPPAPQSELFLKALRAIMHVLARQEISGMENVPEEGPGLLVHNQRSLFDAPLMRVIQPRTDVAGLIAREYREKPILRYILEHGGGIWITRESDDRGALKRALAALDQGWLVGISPEGRRSRTGGLERGNPGVAFLARRAGVPIIPVALVDVDTIAASIKRLRRTTVSIRIGKPFELPPASGQDRRARRQDTVDFIMCRLAALLPSAYRGVYADHPYLAAATSDRKTRLP